MNLLVFGGLLSTPAPTAPIIGIIVGPNYDGMNAPKLGNK